MRVRQVPGDGNCLFHAISVCLEYAASGSHPSLDLADLMPKSASLRNAAVNFLVGEDMGQVLYLENGETVAAAELLEVVAEQYNMTARHYCEVMRQPSVWGGGPEIVALSNALRRPIHVYELTAAGQRFCFKRMACFGSPCYDAHQPIHILSADARFPNLKPGQQLPIGNHFLALFVCNPDELAATATAATGLRGRARAGGRSAVPDGGLPAGGARLARNWWLRRAAVAALDGCRCLLCLRPKESFDDQTVTFAGAGGRGADGGGKAGGGASGSSIGGGVGGSIGGGGGATGPQTDGAAPAA
ncbi:unnamed protein product [Phaeothamnion confervicola]